MALVRTVFISVICTVSCALAEADGDLIEEVAISQCHGSNIKLTKTINRSLQREELEVTGAFVTPKFTHELELLYGQASNIGLQGCFKGPKGRETHFMTYTIDRPMNKVPMVIPMSITLAEGKLLSLRRNADWDGIGGLQTDSVYEAVGFGDQIDISDDPKWFKEMTTLKFDPVDAD